MRNQQSNANPRIALLVDNPSRDLPGLVLIAWRLCQKGATCFLVPMNLRMHDIWPLTPDFILLNHFREIYKGFIENLIDAKILLGVLSTEGSIFSPVPTSANTSVNNSKQETKIMPAMEEYALSMLRDSNLRQKISCYCAWTPTFAEYAKEKGWYSSKQLIVTGTPRMDFYSAQWRNATKTLSTYVDDYSEPIILINSSFTLANPCFQSSKREAEMMINKFSYEQNFVEEWLRTQETALKGLASLANALAKHFPKVTFIFRPHPFESEKTYHKLLEPIPNLHLVKKGTVDGWLMKAKVLIHWESSTAIDSSLSGVPALTAGWLPVHLPVPAVNKVSINCLTENEMKQQIAKVLDGSFSLPTDVAENIDHVVENVFYKIDGCAHKRVADAISKVIRSCNSSPSINRCRFLAYKRKICTFKEKLSLNLKKLLGLPLDWSFRLGKRFAKGIEWERSDKYYDVNQVKTILDAIQECAKSEDQIRKVCVGSAMEHSDLRFGHMGSRTVVMFPE